MILKDIIQYTVWPPHCSYHSLDLPWHAPDRINVNGGSSLMLTDDALSVPNHSVTEAFPIPAATITHKFLVGFKSGLSGGHGSLVMPWLCFHTLTMWLFVGWNIAFLEDESVTVALKMCRRNQIVTKSINIHAFGPFNALVIIFSIKYPLQTSHPKPWLHHWLTSLKVWCTAVGAPPHLNDKPLDDNHGDKLNSDSSENRTTDHLTQCVHEQGSVLDVYVFVSIIVWHMVGWHINLSPTTSSL